MANTERTFIAIKPDGVQRGLVGDIIKRFEQKGFRLVAMKFLRASEDLLKQHYIDLKDRPFYPGLVKYMNSGPVVAMVWEGLNVVKTGRMMLGETNPADSKPGTIRGDFCIQVGRNIIHGSDSVKSAEREISLWFKPEELVDYKSCAFDWIYEQEVDKASVPLAPLDVSRDTALHSIDLEAKGSIFSKADLPIKPLGTGKKKKKTQWKLLILVPPLQLM
ncbi:nucleoside diphosphate kinase B-like [Myotis daubentonii]|nr:nucleoside diphosphate kinase B-like [Myotis daubentonii]